MSPQFLGFFQQHTYVCEYKTASSSSRCSYIRGGFRISGAAYQFPQHCPGRRERKKNLFYFFLGELTMSDERKKEGRLRRKFFPQLGDPLHLFQLSFRTERGRNSNFFVLEMNCFPGSDWLPSIRPRDDTISDSRTVEKGHSCETLSATRDFVKLCGSPQKSRGENLSNSQSGRMRE